MIWWVGMCGKMGMCWQVGMFNRSRFATPIQWEARSTICICVRMVHRSIAAFPAFRRPTVAMNSLPTPFTTQSSVPRLSALVAVFRAFVVVLVPLGWANALLADELPSRTVADRLVAAQPAAAQPAAAQPRRWTTSWSFQDINVGKLQSRLESIGIEIPIDAVGEVSVTFDVGIPVTRLNDPRAYRLSGRLLSKRLRLDDLLLQDFAADVLYEDGVMSLDRVGGRWTDAAGESGAGNFDGAATLALKPRGDATVKLKLQSLVIGPLYDLITKVNQPGGEISGRSNLVDARRNGPQRNAPESVVGTVTGEIDWVAPLETLGDVAKWNANADLQIQDFRIDESLPLTIQTGPVVIRQGFVMADQVQVSSSENESLRLVVATQVELKDRKRFTFQVRGDDVPMDVLSTMAARGTGAIGEKAVEGKVDIDLAGQGELALNTWKVNGRVGSPELRIFQQDLGLIEHQLEFDSTHLEITPIHPERQSPRMLLRRIAANYQLSDESLDITEMDAEVFGGKITGDVGVPLGDAGNYDVGVTWTNIQPSINAAAILPAGLAASTVKIDAVTSGKVDWSFPVDRWDFPAEHRGTVTAEVTGLSIGKADVGNFTLAIDANPGSIDLAGEGKLFGGSFSVETTSPTDAAESWSAWIHKFPIGDLRISSARLDQLAPALNPLETRRFRGTVSANVSIKPTIQGDDDAHVIIQFQSRDFAIDGRSISRSMNANIHLDGQTILIRRASGSYAGGRIDASGSWNLAGGGQTFQVNFSGIDASRAALPFSEGVSSRIAGIVSGSVTVAGENDYRIRGMLHARESGLFSFATGNIHTGIAGSLSGDLSRWRINMPSISGELAGGQVNGRVLMNSSTGLAGAFDLDSQWSAQRADFGQLISEAGSTTTLARGMITGALSLSGKRIRSVNDLSGRFAAEIGQTEASAVPGLLKADQFLGVLSLARTQFDRGEINGSIGRGAYNIEEFWLRSDRVRVFAEGRIGISDLRMDMDAVVSTGSFAGDNAKIMALAAQLAVEAFIPISAIVELNRLFSNRTIFLGVSGPSSDPQVRLKPVETLRQATARFLVREAMVLATAGGRMSN